MRKPTTSRLRVAAVTWRPMLVAVPHRNQAADIEALPDGTLIVTVPLRKPWWWVPPITWLLRPSTKRNVRLDAIGSEIWQWCDGRRTVEDVVDAFADKHRLTFHEARIAVTGFMKSLVQRGILAMEQ